ncbi:hypothetical protein MTO96_020582 [Rhipicephalus appendiculatus]
MQCTRYTTHFSPLEEGRSFFGCWDSEWLSWVPSELVPVVYAPTNAGYDRYVKRAEAFISTRPCAEFRRREASKEQDWPPVANRVTYAARKALSSRTATAPRSSAASDRRVDRGRGAWENRPPRPPAEARPSMPR